MTVLLLFELFVFVFGAGTAAVGIGLLATAAAYCWQLLYRRHLWEAMRQNWFLTAFVIQGLVWCVLSLAGLAGWFTLRRTFGVDMHYLPRQAYYLFFLPLLAVVPYFRDNQLCLEMLRKYGRWVVPVWFLVRIILFHSLGLDNNMLLWMGVLALWCGQYGILDIVNFVLLLAGAYFSNQAATLLLGVLFAGVWLLRRWKILRWLGSLTLPVVLAVSFLLPQVDGMIDRLWHIDANMGWRLEFWADEASAFADTYGVGMGFGTTFASKEFSEPQSEMIYNPLDGRYGYQPFSQDNEYTKEQRPYVTASHNSFVSTAFRQGVLGLVLLIAFLVKVWVDICRYKGPESGAMIFAFCGGVLLISTNVGLESPMYLFPVLGSWCLVSARLNSQKDTSAASKQSR